MLLLWGIVIEIEERVTVSIYAYQPSSSDHFE